jgi:hypothetical protein
MDRFRLIVEKKRKKKEKSVKISRAPKRFLERKCTVRAGIFCIEIFNNDEIKCTSKPLPPHYRKKQESHTPV